MARGARTIIVENEENDSIIDATLWVGRDGDLEIGITDSDLQDSWPMHVAVEIAVAIKKLQDWSTSVEGAKRIIDMQEKEEADYNKHVLKRKPKKSRARKHG